MSSKKNKPKNTLAARVSKKENTTAKKAEIEEEVTQIVEDAEKETSAPTPEKPAATVKPNQNKPKPSKKDKIPTVEAEEVPTPEKPAEPTIPGNLTAHKAAIMKNLANGDRIDANSAIKLMSMMKENWMDNPNTPTQLKEITSQQFDMMALYSLLHWNIQTANDLEEAGLNVNKEMFDKIAEGLSLYFGITVKSIASKNNAQQLQIQFEAPNEIKEEVEKVEKVREEAPAELPVYKEGKTEEEVIKDLEIILAAKNGMGPNLENAVTYARKAFKMEKDEPAKVICAILGKLPKENLLLNGYGRMVYGSTTVNSNPFMSHSLIHKFLPKLNEKEVANVCKLFFSLGAQLNLDSINKKCEPKIKAEDYIAPWNELIKSFTDKTVDNIVSTLSDKTKVVKHPPIKGLTGDTTLDCSKIIATLKSSYGVELNAKQIKQKLSQILNEYQTPINPLDTYMEKGYNTEKK